MLFRSPGHETYRPQQEIQPVLRRPSRRTRHCSSAVVPYCSTSVVPYRERITGPDLTGGIHAADDRALPALLAVPGPMPERHRSPAAQARGPSHEVSSRAAAAAWRCGLTPAVRATGWSRAIIFAEIKGSAMESEGDRVRRQLLRRTGGRPVRRSRPVPRREEAPPIRWGLSRGCAIRDSNPGPAD